jgi:6-phosphofructokinase 1
MHVLVNTGGGDAPGLNAVIRAVTLSALRRGWKVTGIRRGYHGLLEKPEEGLVDLTRDKVRGIAHLGGTILGTVNKGHPFEFITERDGKKTTVDISDDIMRRFREVGGDALIAIGGDGAFRIATRFLKKGMPIVGVPKTIDNDLSCTQATFGFDTAVTVATEAIDRLHTTAESHERIMVVEVMGRYAGWIAMHAGVAGNAHVILLPEIPYDIDRVVERIKRRYAAGRRYCIVVVAEGARPKDGGISTIGEELGREVRLGGIAEKIGAYLGRGDRLRGRGRSCSATCSAAAARRTATACWRCASRAGRAHGRAGQVRHIVAYVRRTWCRSRWRSDRHDEDRARSTPTPVQDSPRPRHLPRRLA